jgi:Domain of unknown function (DUF4157)
MPDYAGKQSRTPSTSPTERTPEPMAGKQTLVEVGAPMVQQRATAGSSDTGPAGSDAVHAAASQGVATPSSSLPFADTIQRSFGRHDVSSVQAHTGPGAAASASAMGADAYATGNHVVLGHKADLFTTAHEAAHVVQQRAGVQLKGGVGEAGDPYEQHANAVAELVTQGKSAEGALDRGPGGTGGPSAGAGASGPIQRSGKGDMAAMDKALSGGDKGSGDKGSGDKGGGDKGGGDKGGQHAQQPETPDVSAFPAMNIGSELTSFRGEGPLQSAIVDAQQQMASDKAVAGLTIAMFHYMDAKAAALAALIHGAFDRIPFEQRDAYLQTLSAKMSPKLGDRGLWVGDDDRGMICVGARDAATFFKEGKALLLQKGGEVHTQQKSLGDLLANHSSNMDAKSYGRRAESMALIDVGSLPSHGAAAAKPKPNTPFACDDPRCKYYNADYDEVAGSALQAGKEYSLYFNGSENLEVTVQSNDGVHVVFSKIA